MNKTIKKLKFINPLVSTTLHKYHLDIYNLVSIEILLLENVRKVNNRISINFKNFKREKLPVVYHVLLMLLCINSEEYLRYENLFLL